MCPICLDDFEPVEDPVEDEQVPPREGVTILPCGHEFHTSPCLFDWVRTGRNTCPLCRAVFDASQSDQPLIPQPTELEPPNTRGNSYDNDFDGFYYWSAHRAYPSVVSYHQYNSFRTHGFNPAVLLPVRPAVGSYSSSHFSGSSVSGFSGGMSFGGAGGSW